MVNFIAQLITAVEVCFNQKREATYGLDLKDLILEKAHIADAIIQSLFGVNLIFLISVW